MGDRCRPSCLHSTNTIRNRNKDRHRHRHRHTDTHSHTHTHTHTHTPIYTDMTVTGNKERDNGTHTIL